MNARAITRHHISLAELRFAQAKLGASVGAIVTPPVAVIVGEQPSEHGQGRGFGVTGPLFPWPAQGSAARLCKMSGVTVEQWLGLFYRRNLFDEFEKGWGTQRQARASERADSITRWIATLPIFDMYGEARVVLLGENVARAFGVPMWSTRTNRMPSAVVSLSAIPHPSGQNLAYNDGENRRAAGDVVRWAIGGKP